MTTILALDQSANENGVCRVRRHVAGQPVYEADRFALTGKGGPRLKALADWLIEEVVDGVDLIAIEVPVHSFGSGIVLHQVAGIVEYVCACRDQPLLYIAPQHVKQWATGKGNASKTEVLLAAVRRFGEQVVTEDMADACFLAEIAYTFESGAEAGSELKRGILAKLHREGEALPQTTIAKMTRRTTKKARCEAV